MRDKIKSAIEAILFACGEPVDISRISDVLQLNEQDVRAAISQLQTEYNGKRGISVLILENSVQMTSDPEFAPEIRAILDLRKSLPLSQASLEVLSVVAYNEPVTKAFIEGVRGVDCTAVLSSLMTKNLIEEYWNMLCSNATWDVLDYAVIVIGDVAKGIKNKKTTIFIDKAEEYLNEYVDDTTD